VSETDGELIVGGYARAGLLWDLNQRLRLGADYRYFIGENIEIFDESLNTDYGQLVFSLGFAF